MLGTKVNDAFEYGHFSPFDKRQLHYYAKAPHEEDENYQPSAAEDMSVGLAEDLVYIIAGSENKEKQSGTPDVKIVPSWTGCGISVMA